jgi:invasion protein IalB
MDHAAPQAAAVKNTDRHRVRRGGALASAAACLLAAALLGPASALEPAAPAQRYRSDDWITECDRDQPGGAPSCAITVPFSDTQGGERGSFALAIALQSTEIAIVGQPFPLAATLQVDKNVPIECHQRRFCLFSREDSLDAIEQLYSGSLVLIDVVTAKRKFEFSLTPKGFKAGMDQIEAWGYSFSGE